MMRVIRWTSLIVAFGILLPPASARAATVSVQIQSYSYHPKTATVGFGDTVIWTNLQGISHTSTSGGYDGYPGPSLWKSPDIPYQGTYSFTFQSAGIYKYHCSIHSGMLASVRVAMTVDPPNGGLTTTFTVTWASTAGIPTGFNEDVQIRRPGTGWEGWKSNLTGAQVSWTFVPDGGTGDYGFRARLQNSSNQGASDWSTPVRITVS